MKIKGLKKVVSGLVATIMVMSSALTSVGAKWYPTEAETLFGLSYLKTLPKKGQANFDKFLEIPDISKLDENRVSPVKHKDGTQKDVEIDEKKVYGQIQEKVNKIVYDVDNDNFEKAILDENRRKEYKNLPRYMKIAGAIYEWVANKIKYDYESTENDESGKKPFRKPQDALFVYQKELGVCTGKANLIDLMMRMAKIPRIQEEGLCCLFTMKNMYIMLFI